MPIWFPRALTAPVILVAGLVTSSASYANSLEIVEAYVPPVSQPGVDAPFVMTITNRGEADTLLRARCPMALFSEKYKVDLGEGAPSKRIVKSIPIPENQTTVLTPDTYHIMLLQISQPLAAGDTFSCSASFAKAGTLIVKVAVREIPPRT